MLHFKITIEVVETGATKTIEREGIENTLDAARKFMWESLPRLTPLAPDVACNWCKMAADSNNTHVTACPFHNTQRG